MRVVDGLFSLTFGTTEYTKVGRLRTGANLAKAEGPSNANRTLTQLQSRSYLNRCFAKLIMKGYLDARANKI